MIALADKAMQRLRRRFHRLVAKGAAHEGIPVESTLARPGKLSSPPTSCSTTPSGVQEALASDCRTAFGTSTATDHSAGYR